MYLNICQSFINISACAVFGIKLSVKYGLTSKGYFLPIVIIMNLPKLDSLCCILSFICIDETNIFHLFCSVLLVPIKCNHQKELLVTSDDAMSYEL